MVSINFISDVLVLQCSTNVGGVSGRGLGRPSTNHRSVGVVDGVVSVGCRPIKFYIVELTFYHYSRLYQGHDMRLLVAVCHLYRCQWS